jgi:hypothetical protein
MPSHRHASWTGFIVATFWLQAMLACGQDQEAGPPPKIKPAKAKTSKDSAGVRAKRGKPDEAAPREVLAPGKGLRSTDAQRDRINEDIARITKISGADVAPVESQHITLWAAKELQPAFLADVKKLEKFFRTKCREPFCSGLDKRAAHVLLIKRRYEYQKWLRAMFEVMAERVEQKDNPGATEQWKAWALQGTGLYFPDFVVFCLEGQQPEYQHRIAAAGVGYMYFTQLAEYRMPDPLCTGFADGAENVVLGSPSVTIFMTSYGNQDRKVGVDPRAWLQLVQQRFAAGQASAVGQLLKMDTTNMLLPHYAEAWSLVALLAKQPDKLAELVVALRENKSALEVIEQVYGWDEKQLTERWHKSVSAQR